MAELLKKKIHLKLGEYGNPIEDFGTQLWGIPKLDCTSTQWATIWSDGWRNAQQLQQGIEWAIRSMFVDAGITANTQPSSFIFDPWVCGRSAILDMDDIDWYTPFYSVSKYLYYHPPSYPPRFIFEDENGNALNWGPSDYDTLWYNGTGTRIADGRIMPYSLGFIGSYQSIRAGLYFVAITSDDKFLTCKYYYDQGNSNYTIKDSTPLLNWINELPPFIPPDPYEPGGNSDTGGGGGTFTDDNIPVDFSDGPTLGATNTGFITLFKPTLSELQALASYMWTNPLFDLANWKKIFADPMDAILGLSIVPVSPGSAGSRNVKVGNIDTTVSMTVAASQYVPVDCGSISVSEWWGAYLDYEPYTKAELYLPYCGVHPISIDEIMAGNIHVHYWVDILSGACVAEVKCKDSVLYTFAGQCASSIPITGRDWTNVINGVLGIAGSVGSMIATGGASAPASIAGLASTATNLLKPSIEKSGSLGGTSGMLAGQTPILILTRPNQAKPARQNEFIGYPSFITRTLGEVDGYCEVEQVHLENIPATGDELSEIERLLKEGVIL